MNDGRRRKFTPIGELLDGLLEQSLPGDRALRARLAAETFLRVVGPPVARHCRVGGLSSGVLQVEVETPRWRRELELMSGDCLRRVNDELPPPLRLTGLEFRDQVKKKREP